MTINISYIGKTPFYYIHKCHECGCLHTTMRMGDDDITYFCDNCKHSVSEYKPDMRKSKKTFYELNCKQGDARDSAINSLHKWFYEELEKTNCYVDTYKVYNELIEFMLANCGGLHKF